MTTKEGGDFDETPYKAGLKLFHGKEFKSLAKRMIETAAAYSPGGCRTSHTAFCRVHASNPEAKQSTFRVFRSWVWGGWEGGAGAGGGMTLGF